MTSEQPVRAAGAVLWRGTGPSLELAMVHRPKYHDWSWPKGKLDLGESFPCAAVREVREETGAQVTLGIPLIETSYSVSTQTGSRRKIVKYWAAHWSGQQAQAIANPEEVDRVRWVSPAQAEHELTYRWDRLQIPRLVAADQAGTLRAWPLVVVRHARAFSRAQWAGGQQQPPLPDQLRPLDELGQARAQRLVPLLAAYRPTRVLSSPAVRCLDTVLPYTRSVGPHSELACPEILSEEGFHADSAGLSRYLDRITRRPKPTLLCSHRPVLPALFAWLGAHCGDETVAADIRESRGPGLVKGEVLVAQLVGAAERARVISVERVHAP